MTLCPANPCLIFSSINLPAMLRIAQQAGKVWEIDPLEYLRCGREMKMIALIDDRAVIERILRSLGLWSVNLQPAVINMHVTGPPEPNPTFADNH